ncbi:MAG TPA: DMT family transporter [Paraburkholderia sp.]|jgi:drug/metabolite transporter (DMT)-like permease|nr:DMT family transporter [Paraburkholderia sp.]
MNPTNIVQLLVLAAIWGGSFLFIRIGVTDFGVAPLVAVRVGVGALFLLAALFATRPARDVVTTLRSHARALLIVGILNSAAPFCLFSWAEYTLSAGVTSVLNATTPLWGALVAWLWLKDRLSGLRVVGLAIGFVGVIALVWDQVAAPPPGGATATTTALAAAAGLAAALLYGIAASYTKRHLTGVEPLVVAAGTMTGASLVLLPFAVFTWPTGPVSVQSWAAAIALGIACTGIAYLMYFRLIASIGPARTITVTFVIPVFGILWGALFLGERVSAGMVDACVAILAGTVLATGVVARLPGVRAGSRRADAKR